MRDSPLYDNYGNTIGWRCDNRQPGLNRVTKLAGFQIKVLFKQVLLIAQSQTQWIFLKKSGGTEKHGNIVIPAKHLVPIENDDVIIVKQTQFNDQFLFITLD